MFIKVKENDVLYELFQADLFGKKGFYDFLNAYSSLSEALRVRNSYINEDKKYLKKECKMYSGIKKENKTYSGKGYKIFRVVRTEVLQMLDK